MSIDVPAAGGASLRSGRAVVRKSRALRRSDRPTRPAVGAVLVPLRDRHPERALPALPLAPLVAEYTRTYGSTWSRATRRKHADDFGRFVAWLDANGRPATTAALEFLTLVDYVEYLRTRPKITSSARFRPEELARPGGTGILSANSVGSYVRPLRSLAIWLVDEGLLGVDPFRRSRRRAALNPLLPSEETPTKGATLADLQALERGCAGEAPLDLRDRAIVAVLVTTAARNSSVRLLLLADVDFERSIIRFRRAKGGKTLEIALHSKARAVLAEYIERGRPTLVDPLRPAGDPGYLFPSWRGAGSRPLGMGALSLMLTRRHRAGGGTLRSFGSHRIRHATATLLVNNGMPLEEVSRYLGHSSIQVTLRYAKQTPDSLGRRAAEALARAGVATE